MILPAYRRTNLIVFGGCLSLILIALFYFQNYLGLDPCPLCIMERVAVILTGLVALLAFLHNPAGLGKKVYSFLGLIFALAGAGISIRHLWLQNLPADAVPACGPGLNYILENLDLYNTKEIISMMFSGTGDCAKVVWTFLGLSIPGWMLIMFTGLVGINGWQWVRK